MSAAANFLTIPARAAQPLHVAGLRALSLSHAAEQSTDRLTDSQYLRHEVESLCSHMLWLRAWWECHGDAIRAADRQTAAGIHDHFIDGAMFARSIARAGCFDLDEDRIRNYSWGRNIQTIRMMGGAQ